VKVGRGTKSESRLVANHNAQPLRCPRHPADGGGAACASDPEPQRRVHTRDGFRFVVPATRSRTPGISCEAVPASIRAGAGMRRHVRTSHSGLPCNHAAESFVSFIPLFGGPAQLPDVHATSEIGAAQLAHSLAYTEGARQATRVASIQPFEPRRRGVEPDRCGLATFRHPYRALRAVDPQVPKASRQLQRALSNHGSPKVGEGSWREAILPPSVRSLGNLHGDQPVRGHSDHPRAE